MAEDRWRSLAARRICIGLAFLALPPLQVQAAPVVLVAASKAVAASAVSSVVVSGRVTRAETGEPMENVRVEGHQGSVPLFAAYVTETFTDAAGNYVLTLPDASTDTKTYVRTRHDNVELVPVDAAWRTSVCPAGSFYIGQCTYGPPLQHVATTNNVSVAGIDLALAQQRIFVGEFE